jgi:acyl-CoA reductase-like NAD-dependent aldehyde dehydrogenase
MTTSAAARSSLTAGFAPAIDEIMRRARDAFATFRDVSQERADEAVRALAWSVYKPDHARELAELAVADTHLGNVADKICQTDGRHRCIDAFDESSGDPGQQSHDGDQDTQCRRHRAIAARL